jgi:hypothetical protein
MITIASARLGSDKQIIPFHPQHLHRIELKQFELEYLEAFPDYFEYVAANYDPHRSWTGMVGGKIVCIFGITMLWPRVAEAWMIPSVHIKDSPIAVARAAKKIIAESASELGLNRLQICVRVDNVIAYRFARSLGFKVECEMKEYGPEGADYYLMSRR